MPRVALPTRDGRQRMGLAALWQAEPSPVESFITQAKALVLILFSRLKAAPLAALAAVVSLSAVISLSSVLVVLAINVRQTLTQGTSQIAIRVVPLATQAVPDLQKRIEALTGVRNTRVISKADALEEFSRTLGESKGLLDGLETDNPLPITIELELGDLGVDPQRAVEQLVDQLHHQEGVEEVVYNASLVSSLGELLKGVKVFGASTILAVLMIGAFLVGMTIRLGVYAHRHEIEVMQLVGADQRHIQLPFLVEGVSVGIVASVVSASLVMISMRWFDHALHSSGISWMMSGTGPSAPWWVWAAMLIAGPLLALLGAAVALRLQGQR